MSVHRKRRVRNLDLVDELVEGTPVLIYLKGDWVDGKIFDVRDGKNGYPLVTVTLGNGAQETLDIAYISIKNGKESHYPERRKSYSKHGSHRSRSRDSESSSRRSTKYRRHECRSLSQERYRSKHRETDNYPRSSSSKQDLLNEFKRREREKALATGKGYAKRPTSYKSSLSSRLDAKHGRS
ncbi:hypothetical protein BEWA_010550 [Theileria equi strain WA]|uniref:Uncharacterized protein n=1 Tax=Theileria equi strain WA TaxID=1537102 RepID=L0B2B7_THEEQ|nr:hypothetical protein BEWA_010550 [Theileria equi strain WA]AFZ81638.1 hypothetical protein BEWA_010550 [Theileria equi strain WA]|eukprot:XP_004831304.1 hypothetical protein BEWA_010550 [Theileria equi strain WA]